MGNLFRKMKAFVYRDFISDTTYKATFILQFFGLLFSVLTYFFLSRLMGDIGVEYLKPYGGNYFSFVLIGIAFFSYLNVSMKGLAGIIREGQMLGTLEAILVTPTSIPTIIFSSLIYGFFWATFEVAIYLLLGAVYFDVNLGQVNLTATLMVLFLTIISFIGLGILSASFIMVLKRGDPIGWLFTSVSGLIGGLYYPTTVLPEWLQTAAKFFPVTHSLEGMRLAILKGYTVSQLASTILILCGFSAVILPSSILVFQQAIKKAKRDGSLTHY
ncbi:ABC transporter permease [Desulfosarcina sp.]|uniref:ABC transporter permease n=1 Tax=Desulfosarcina sp. TaxID=2027861 RepID=UPI0035670B6C